MLFRSAERQPPRPKDRPIAAAFDRESPRLIRGRNLRSRVRLRRREGAVQHRRRLRRLVDAFGEQEMPLDKAAREGLVMDLFRRRRISTGKACQLLSLDRMDFVSRADELGVPVHLTTETEWEADMATLDAWRERQS